MIIVLTGQKRTGKSTAADFFKQKNFKPVALADPFKKDLAYTIDRLNILGRHFSYQDANGETDFDREKKIFSKTDAIRVVNFSYRRILGDDSKYNHVEDLIQDYFNSDKRNLYSFRELMQITGTDIGCNEIDKNIWVKKTFNEIIDSKSRDFLISDCRQNHEISALRKFGSLVIHIKRDTSDIVEKDQHITEKPLDIDDSDLVIDNNGTIEEFYQKLENALNLVNNK